MMKDKPSITPVKHVPQRTCIACRKTGVKRELVRLVNIPGVQVEVDPTGKKSGRGAYLCPSRTCWENALKTGRLGQALRTNISPDNKARLLSYTTAFDHKPPPA
jgi:predicted RNA-binding protein YlxR (DUF448 family)